MVRHAVLIPVTTQRDDLCALLNQTWGNQTIIVNNFVDPEVALFLSQNFGSSVSIRDFPENKGCAASWNIGLRLVEAGDYDYMVILSPSCRWNTDLTSFTDLIDASEEESPKHFYLAQGQHGTDTHAFAITRRCVDEIGLYDENFHPVYYEDTDYSRRQALAGSPRTTFFGLRTSAPLGGGVRHPLLLAQYQRSAERIAAYYREKWGGDHLSESFPTPFNDPALTIKDWTLRPEQLIPY